MVEIDTKLLQMLSEHIPSPSSGICRACRNMAKTKVKPVHITAIHSKCEHA